MKPKSQSNSGAVVALTGVYGFSENPASPTEEKGFCENIHGDGQDPDRRRILSS
jgi:hypothetical protein